MIVLNIYFNLYTPEREEVWILLSIYLESSSSSRSALTCSILILGSCTLTLKMWLGFYCVNKWSIRNLRCVGWGFSMGTEFQFHSWRVFVLVCFLPSVAALVGLFFIPESPRYLLQVIQLLSKDLQSIISFCKHPEDWWTFCFCWLDREARWGLDDPQACPRYQLEGKRRTREGVSGV